MKITVKDGAPRILLLCCILSQLGLSDGAYKRWLPNTNYDNPQNWDKAAVPCPNDVVHFPPADTPVFMQSNFSTVALVLPVNGELVLADNMVISFPTQHSNAADCPGQDVHFVGTASRSWLDPENWCEGASQGYGCLSKQPSRLDTEKVPCQHDRVVFPKHSALNLDLENVDVSVDVLTIAEQPAHSEEYRTTVAGWSNTGSLNVQEDTSCDDDPAGCLCGNDHGPIRSAICKHQSPRCPPAHCVQPLSLDAHCCPICGYKMELEYTKDFRFSTLYNVLKYQYNKRTGGGGGGGGGSDVTFVMTRSGAGHILVVLWDAHGGHAAADVGQSMSSIVQKDIDGTQKYGLVEMRVSMSAGEGPSTGAQTGRREGLSNGSIAGIILSIGLLLVIVIICLICFMDRGQCRRWKSQLTPRWGKKEDEVQLSGSIEMGPTPGIQDASALRPQAPPDPHAMPQGFDNPLYGTSTDMQQANVRDPSSSDSSSGDGGGGSGLDANANTRMAAPTTEIDVSDAAPEDVTFTADKNMAGNTSFNNPLYGNGKKQQSPSERHGLATIDEGFSNPMYAENGDGDFTYQGSMLKLNPVYSDEGIDEESHI